MSDAILIPAWVDGTLQPVEKLAVHERGLRHKAISVFVISGDKILLHQRALSKYHTPGLWTNTCCTHPHWGEDAATCATRRLSEEMGITGLDLTHVQTAEYRAYVGGGLTEHEVVEIFTAEAPMDLPMTLDPEEVAATRWEQVDDLLAKVRRNPEDYTPWLRIYLEEHRAAIFGDMAPA